MKKTLIQSLVITLILTIVFTTFFYLIPQSSLMSLSNTLTMGSLLLLIVGLFVTILSSGFFDFFINSFRRIQHNNTYPFQSNHTTSKHRRQIILLFLAIAVELFVISIFIFLLH